MKPKYQRLTYIILMLTIAASVLFFFLNQLEESIIYFYSPTDIAQKPPAADQFIRAGGLVARGSVVAIEQNVRFRLEDGANSVRVQYFGALPSLFREGQGIIAEGYLKGGELQAQKILAKHDEKYMPPEVAKALKKNNYWRK